MTENNEILIKLNKDQALVLFEFLARFSDEGHKNIFKDHAEEIILWKIEGQLEKILVEPFMPNYPDILIEARNRIRNME